MSAREPYEFKPLENVARELESVPVKELDQLKRELRERGLDPQATSARVQTRISEFLRRKRKTDESVSQKARQAPLPASRRKWRNPSVRRFSESGDPIQEMVSRANSTVLMAYQDNLATPSEIDPFVLADLLRIRVVPREDIPDARTIPLSSGRLQIEFNPRKPKARVRFSIAHEIAHSLLPDCHERVRNRAARADFRENDWELEMLCNIGAAELLMPIASFPELKEEQLGIDHLMQLRRKYEVSSEALLLRVAALTDHPCFAFAAHRKEEREASDPRYSLDYIIPSRSWKLPLRTDFTLGKDSLVAQCTASGFTAIGDEVWQPLGKLHIECVGISPYPNRRYPRVVGIASSLIGLPAVPPRVVEVIGDATDPRGGGKKIVAHVVNDKTPNWGAGFGRAVASRWPLVQEMFRSWAFNHRAEFSLGAVFKTEVDPDLCVFQMIAQHGYGPAAKPRIRYGALKIGLEELGKLAVERNATVHMPRIGSGYAAGVWGIIHQMIDETLCRRGVGVTIYNLAGAQSKQPPELPGLFSASQTP